MHFVEDNVNNYYVIGRVDIEHFYLRRIISFVVVVIDVAFKFKCVLRVC